MFDTTTNERIIMAKTTNLAEIDLRDAHIMGDQPITPYYDNLVRVTGSTKSGYAEMFGVLTGVSFTRRAGDSLDQVIVYMEGQQHTVFDATKSGIWIVGVHG